MTTIEAYEFTLSKIEELRQKGIMVKVKPYDAHLITEKLLKENSTPEQVPSSYWNQYKLVFSNESQRKAIKETLNYLNMAGIQFDTGGCGMERDWELDWSFHYSGEESEDYRDAIDGMEEEIKNCGNAS